MNYNFAKATLMTAESRASRHKSLRERFSGRGDRQQPVKTHERELLGNELVAIWAVNASTGRIECRWTKDVEEIALWESSSPFERFGLIVAAARQNRVGSVAH
jgi:hypothetical protein